MPYYTIAQDIFWKSTVMKTTYRALLLTTTLAFIAGCATPTAPKSSTYWIKDDGSSYQTHRERIKTHDKRMECQEVVSDRKDSKSLSKEEAYTYFQACMTEKHYIEIPNRYLTKKADTK